MIQLCVEPSELKKALEDFKEYEKQGFGFSLPIFSLSESSKSLSDCKMTYSGGMVAKAHPTDEHLNWGTTTKEDLKFIKK